MDGPVNVCLVGYGLAGSTFHAPLIAATPGMRLHAVVSSDAAKVLADLPDAVVHGSAAQAFADPKVDLIVIATPDALHAPQAIAALEAGKHVVVDKPFALTLAEARALAEQAKRSDRMLSVFHNRRWDSDFLTVQRLIGTGALGEIVQYESHFDRFRPAVRDRWRERAGAGLWRDLGPHLLDQALALFGPPAAIQADFAEQRAGALAPDYFHVLLRYPRRRVILHASMLTPAADLRLAVHGTRASFVKYGLDAQEAALRAGLRPGGTGWGIDPRPGMLLVPEDESGTRSHPFESVAGDYPAYYAAVRDCIRHGAPNPVPPAQALAVMALLDAGAQSAAERREIDCALPPG